MKTVQKNSSKPSKKFSGTMEKQINHLADEISNWLFDTGKLCCKVNPDILGMCADCAGILIKEVTNSKEYKKWLKYESRKKPV